MGLGQVFSAVGRNFTSVLVPSFVFGCIAIDYSRSLSFKKANAVEEAKKEDKQQTEAN